ncbi:hypothetical protein [Methylobacterium komagatae]
MSAADVKPGQSVFVTKFALSDGIVPTTVTAIKNGIVFVAYHRHFCGEIGVTPSEYHTTREGAAKRAEQLRQMKVAGLRRQLAKFEAISFSAPDQLEDGRGQP